MLTPQEIADRVHYTGASDVKDLFPEETKYGCPRRLYYQKTSAKPDYDFTAEQEALFRRGHEVEPLLKLALINAGFEAVANPRLYSVTERLKAHIDFDVWHPDRDDGRVGVGEGKTANKYVFRALERDGLDMGYILQAQTEFMALPARKWGVVIVRNMDTWRDQILHFEPIPEIQTEIGRRNAEFWTGLESGRVPLRVDDSGADARCQSCLYARGCLGYAEYEGRPAGAPADGEVRTEELNGVMLRIVALNEVMKEAKAACDEAKEKVREFADHNGSDRIVSSVGDLTCKAQSKTTTDEKLLEQKFPDAFAATRKPGKPSRAIRVWLKK